MSKLRPKLSKRHRKLVRITQQRINALHLGMSLPPCPAQSAAFALVKRLDLKMRRMLGGVRLDTSHISPAENQRRLLLDIEHAQLAYDCSVDYETEISARELHGYNVSAADLQLARVDCTDNLRDLLELRAAAAAYDLGVEGGDHA